ncbi:GNAT family N-acetyltransferase [Ruegeria profundi]|uniref:Acetyltransferase n=1 Tax=Ruegeria profundi TaxID=1685378 RepID=A0A0X3U904_9RHOB|nr:GNAT family N-acetyltransferase [Ruegeria profundi]KUJ82040.1 acetyltransferase [Ruegeria profundi]
MLRITEPTTPDQVEAVRRLCWDYRDFLLTLDAHSQKIVRTFYPHEKYARMLSSIETEHSPPNGGMRLAVKDDQPVGCGMFHTIAPRVAEIKRVFVADSVRGAGVGFAIMQSLIEQCRERGFDYIRMDTGKPMQTAARLYLSMGFSLRDAYSEIPEIARGHLLFFEMDLRANNSA